MLVFHRREWRVQRIGWTLMAALLGLACLGLFGGGGPLSDSSLADGNVTVEYERFARRSAQTTLTIIPTGQPAGGELELGISREYLRAFKVDRVTPEPREVRGDPDRLTFVFAATSPATPVQFHLEPEEVGSRHARIFTGAHAPLELDQFIYP